MGLFWQVAHLVAWAGVAGLGLLLWGQVRALRLLNWRLEQWELASPRRRRDLAVGTRAPDFRLPAAGLGQACLRDFTDRKVLLVFADTAGELLPELHGICRRQHFQVLLVQNRTAAEAEGPGDGESQNIRVLRQSHGRLSRRYRVVETPFAFVIDERGVIAAKGVIRNGAHLDFLLDIARAWAVGAPTQNQPAESDATPTTARLRTFRPRADDIFVATYPRSGTTWTQMILYQLMTDGRMDFAHITQVSPWFERALKAGQDLDALPGPRVLKSHLSYRRIPKGPCRYIYVARDGKDVAVSYYHFYRSHMEYTGTLDEFLERFIAGEVSYGSWRRHVEGWRAHRSDPNVLFLNYEDLVRDLAGTLRQIACFCERDVTPEHFDTIMERCSFGFMKAHESQFDPLMGMMWERGARPNAHLRNGQAGSWKDHLSPAQTARLDRAFGRRLQGQWNGFGAPTTVA